MTVADVIRGMSDSDLANFLALIVSERDKVISESLREQGIENTLYEAPALSVIHHLNFIQRPAEEVFEWW